MTHSMKHLLVLGALLLAALGPAVAQGPKATAYDSDGDIVEIRYFDSNDSTRLVRSEHYVYGRRGNLAAILFYTYSSESGIIETHGAKAVRHDLIKRSLEYSADEQLLVKACYRHDRHGRCKRYKVTSYNGDGTTSTTRDLRRYKHDHCYQKVYIDGKLAYRQDYDCPRSNAVRLKHRR